MDTESENNLLGGIRRGDESALGAIYDRYGTRVYGFIYRMTLNASLAEDITHEAFLVLIEQPNRYRAERGSLLTFLCSVARNSLMNHLRRRHNKDAWLDDIDNFDVPEVGSKGNPLATLLDQELAARVETCVAALPPLQREVVILREYEDLSYEEIAGITDTTTGVVKARLHRARQNLTKALAGYVEPGKKDKCYELQ